VAEPKDLPIHFCHPFPFIPGFSQANDSQTTRLKRIANGNIPAGRVIGVVDGDITSVMRAGRAMNRPKANGYSWQNTRPKRIVQMSEMARLHRRGL